MFLFVVAPSKRRGESLHSKSWSEHDHVGSFLESFPSRIGMPDLISPALLSDRPFAIAAPQSQFQPVQRISWSEHDCLGWFLESFLNRIGVPDLISPALLPVCIRSFLVELILLLGFHNILWSSRPLWLHNVQQIEDGLIVAVLQIEDGLVVVGLITRWTVPMRLFSIFIDSDGNFVGKRTYKSMRLWWPQYIFVLPEHWPCSYTRLAVEQ